MFLDETYSQLMNQIKTYFSGIISMTKIVIWHFILSEDSQTDTSFPFIPDAELRVPSNMYLVSVSDQIGLLLENIFFHILCGNEKKKKTLF